ncbi:CHAT domain-containing protein [Streptomyces sp. TX20-6-3]|uniref:CHAT domain-containing protein n=1 Tax=Streptomyces sp. TX20-6-3 TaxID=3028705 RepID=UPI0029AD4939|nr:CHAT domain-containing protein [Streptomyces sp. TX20-6-3]MDX2561275.1 CHAT domain-containing protein [Streptomyces sp. TX20-6-3]
MLAAGAAVPLAAAAGPAGADSAAAAPRLLLPVPTGPHPVGTASCVSSTGPVRTASRVPGASASRSTAVRRRAPPARQTFAFQLAGFPHVGGALWEIDDQIAVTVADAFYTHLRGPDGTIDTDRAAWALHQAVRDVRDGHDLPGRLDRTRIPFLWAAYLHAGA